MKKFTFPLARVLDWRRTQLRIEEAKLEQLHGELRAIEARREQTLRAREESGKALIAGGRVSGADLQALDHYRKAAAAEAGHLAQSAGAIRQQIAKQMQALIRKRRDAKLLEHLREERFANWNRELAREIDREASELHLLKPRPR